MSTYYCYFTEHVIIAGKSVKLIKSSGKFNLDFRDRFIISTFIDRIFVIKRERGSLNKAISKVKLSLLCYDYVEGYNGVCFKDKIYRVLVFNLKYKLLY